MLITRPEHFQPFPFHQETCKIAPMKVLQTYEKLTTVTKKETMEVSQPDHKMVLYIETKALMKTGNIELCYPF